MIRKNRGLGALGGSPSGVWAILAMFHLVVFSMFNVLFWGWALGIPAWGWWCLLGQPSLGGADTHSPATSPPSAVGLWLP